MAVGPYFRLRTFSPDEGIVVRHASVGPDPHHLAQMAVEIPGLVAQLVALTEGHEQRAVPREDQPRTEMMAPVGVVVLGEDDCLLIDTAPIRIEPSPRHRRARTARRPLREAEEDERIPGKPGAHDHVQQPTLPTRMHRRHARQRGRNHAISVDQAQTPDTLADQHPPVRQKSQRPRYIEALRNALNTHRPRFGGGNQQGGRMRRLTDARHAKEHGQGRQANPGCRNHRHDPRHVVQSTRQIRQCSVAQVVY